MELNQQAKLKSICNRENVKMYLIKAPRYIAPFLFDSEDIILVRKEGSMPAPFTPLIKVKDEDQEEEYDLTGSPLQTSLNDSLLTSPLAHGIVNVNEYYNHAPLSVDHARRFVNIFALSGNPSFEESELPVWVLGDASDESRTVLVMLWRRDDGWITRGAAVLEPSHLILQKMNPSLDYMLKGHLKIAGADKGDVTYQAKACYNCNKNEVSDVVDEFGDSGASLKMHLSWRRPHTHFSFPPYDALSHLEANVTVGCQGSALWQDIEKLQEIGGLMESCPTARENQLLMSMATVNLTVMASSARSQVHSYICSGKLPPSLCSARPPSVPKTGVGHVLDIYEEVTEGRRPNVDVTEVLWDILKGCNDLVDLNSCFKMIIREAASGRFMPKILPDNKTSVSKIIKGAQDILQSMSLTLKGNEALRLLWELGYLKLHRDYRHLLQTLELKSSEVYDAFKCLKASPVVTEQQREEGMENLVAVHSFVETLMLLKSQLNVDNASLSLLVTSALPQLISSALDYAKHSSKRSPDSCFMDFSAQRMTFSIPVRTKISIPLIKGCFPESWSFGLHTVKPKRKIVTIFYENSDGVFPPEVHEKGDKAGSNSKENTIVKFTMLSDHLFHRG